MLDVHRRCVCQPPWIQFLIGWTGLLLDRVGGDGDRFGIWHRSAVLSVGTSRTHAPELLRQDEFEDIDERTVDWSSGWDCREYSPLGSQPGLCARHFAETPRQVRPFDSYSGVLHIGDNALGSSTAEFVLPTSSGPTLLAILT